MPRYVRRGVFLALFFGSACEKHHWEGIVYPKTGTMPFDVVIGHFASLEECRAAARAVLGKVQPEPGSTPDYECGRDCTINNDLPQFPWHVCHAHLRRNRKVSTNQLLPNEELKPTAPVEAASSLRSLAAFCWKRRGLTPAR